MSKLFRRSLTWQSQTRQHPQDFAAQRSQHGDAALRKDLAGIYVEQTAPLFTTLAKPRAILSAKDRQHLPGGETVLAQSCGFVMSNLLCAHYVGKAKRNSLRIPTPHRGPP